jgi:hypothetical protein
MSISSHQGVSFPVKRFNCRERNRNDFPIIMFWTEPLVFYFCSPVPTSKIKFWTSSNPPKSTLWFLSVPFFKSVKSTWLIKLHHQISFDRAGKLFVYMRDGQIRVVYGARYDWNLHVGREGWGGGLKRGHLMTCIIWITSTELYL